MTADPNEHTITQAVLDRFASTPDSRLKRVMGGLVRHPHEFVRDVEPSFTEWQEAIGSLTRTGQTCGDTRHEFILPSDTLGVSMPVDAVTHRQPVGATETTALGPFYVRPPKLPLGADVSPEAPGEPLFVEGTVSSAGGGRPAGAVVDVWHSDGDGFYDVRTRREKAPDAPASAPTHRAGSTSGRSGRPTTPSRTTAR